MGLGDVFSTTFSIFRRRARTLLGLSALELLAVVLSMVPMVVAFASLLPLLVPALNRPGAFPDFSGLLVPLLVSQTVTLVLGLVAGVVQTYLDGLMVLTADQAMQQQLPSFAQVRQLGSGLARRVVGLYVLAYVAVFVVVGIAMVPGMMGVVRLATSGSSMKNDTAMMTALSSIIATYLLLGVFGLVATVFAVRLIYVLQALAVERLGARPALRRAWSLTKGSFWRTLGYLIVMAITASFVQQIAGVVGEFFLIPTMMSQPTTTKPAEAMLHTFTSPGFWAAMAVMYLLVFAVQLVIRPLMMTFVTVMYRDQVERFAD